MDRIQRYLVKKGRSDLAQEYYENYTELKKNGFLFDTVSDANSALKLLQKAGIDARKTGNKVIIPGTHTRQLGTKDNLKDVFKKIDPAINVKGNIAWQSGIKDKDKIHGMVKKVLMPTISNERDESTDELAVFYYDFDGTVRDLLKFLGAAIMKIPIHLLKDTGENPVFGINGMVLEFEPDYSEVMKTRVLQPA